MNIKKSLYYRVKSYILKYEVAKVKSLNNINVNADLQIDMIETMETAMEYLKNSTVLLDVGAHKGFFSKTANLFFCFEKTICFEPNKNLNNNIVQNDINNCTIENIALSDKNQTTTYFLHEDDTMNSIVRSDNNLLKTEFPWDNPEKMQEESVTSYTLDSYIEKNNLTDKTFFLKIDTQGNELNILKHGVKTLEKTEICIIEFMFLTPYKSNYNFVDLITFMHDNDFDCKGALNITKRPSKKISAVDFLFVKR